MRATACVIVGCLFGAGGAYAQTQPPSGKTLAATMNVYAFPQAGQNADKQSKDESDCYGWATSNTGSDPFALSKQQAQQQQQTQQQVQQAKAGGQGAGGQGAAWGAAVGAVSARRRAKAQSEAAAQQAEQSGAQKQQATAQQIDNFKKAFSVCLEGKQYLVKY
jgi:hypothetical protein